MHKNKFTEKDKEHVVEFLNMVAEHAKFEMTTKEVIKYFKALSIMQQQILPKIESNIFEITKVVEAEQPKPKSKTTKKKK